MPGRVNKRTDLFDVLEHLVDRGGGARRIEGTQIHVAYTPGQKFELSRLGEDVAEGTMDAVIVAMRKLDVALDDQPERVTDANGWHILRWRLERVELPGPEKAKRLPPSVTVTLTPTAEQLSLL